MDDLLEILFKDGHPRLSAVEPGPALQGCHADLGIDTGFRFPADLDRQRSQINAATRAVWRPGFKGLPDPAIGIDVPRPANSLWITGHPRDPASSSLRVVAECTLLHEIGRCKIGENLVRFPFETMQQGLSSPLPHQAIDEDPDEILGSVNITEKQESRTEGPLLPITGRTIQDHAMKSLIECDPKAIKNRLPPDSMGLQAFKFFCRERHSAQ